MNDATPTEAAFVSCDIVGHGRNSAHARQVQRIEGLNNCIRRVCKSHFGQGVVWASGGDGGHVAFLDSSLRETAVQLIHELFKWSQEQEWEPPEAKGVKLRLTAHHGPVSIIEGADLRQQLVGDGINLCGSLLSFGTPGAVLATAAFRDFILQGQGQGSSTLDAIRFHDERSIYLKHFFAHRVCFLSMEGAFQSQPGFPAKSDRRLLRDAIESKSRWRTIYHAKRLLQVDSSDKDAQQALESINPAQLTYVSDDGEEFEAHPLLSQMNKQALRELILASHLIEREDGDVICARDDAGDSMFIVLKGQIGVVLNHDKEAGGEHLAAPVDLRFGEGKILGELALALQRERTATLQAVGGAALLSINFATLQNLLSGRPKNVRLERSFNEFLLERVLEYLCRNVPYLADGEDAPLSGIDAPWEQLLDDSERITFSWRELEVIDSSDEKFQEPGLYVLASGRLTDASQCDVVRKVLDERDFPLLFVDLPNELVNVHHTFRVDPDADFKTITIARISDHVLKSWGPNVYTNIVKAVRARLASQFLYDVFISYNHRDEEIARAWCEAMQQAGLLVYMSQPEAMRRFKTEIELALSEALVMVPFVSTRAQGADGAQSWVQREIGYRKTLFDVENSNILPVEITPGIAAEFADGFSAVTITEGGQDAIEETISTIRQVRAGLKPPPFARRRVNMDMI